MSLYRFIVIAAYRVKQQMKDFHMSLSAFQMLNKQVNKYFKGKIFQIGKKKCLLLPLAEMLEPIQAS